MKAKLKICSICHDTCILWASTPKMCKSCATWAKINAEKETKPTYKGLKQTEGETTAKPFKVSRKKLTGDQQEYKKSLDAFFKTQITMIPEQCENCDIKLTGYHESELRGLIAHILPKSPNSGFPEVATHPLNRMFLGTKCGCHSKYDNNDAEGRKKMPVYSIAKSRYEKFKNNLQAKQYVKACDYMGIDWQ